VKKALALTQAGLPAIAISGVYNAHDAEWKKSHPGEWILHPDFAGVTLNRGGAATPEEPDWRGHRLCAQPVGRVDAVPHRPAPPHRQQRVGARPPVAALGRKNFLFVSHDEAGENLAGLYSLIATCEANGVNPLDYFADVLLRVRTHPASRIDELLPHNWTPPRPQPST
jgi:hypothetical protein